MRCSLSGREKDEKRRERRRGGERGSERAFVCLGTSQRAADSFASCLKRVNDEKVRKTSRRSLANFAMGVRVRAGVRVCMRVLVPSWPVQWSSSFSTVREGS